MQNLFYYIKIIPSNKADRWDELSSKAIAGQITEACAENSSDDFSDFNNTETKIIDDRVLIEDEKIADNFKDKKHSVDLLKQIFDKEFHHQDIPLIKKPPRKSLENLNHKTDTIGSYSSFKSLPYDVHYK